MQSCATIIGGQKTDHQRYKPKKGDPRREIRVKYIILDLIFTGGTGIAVDFLTKKIYKRFPNSRHIK